MYLLLAEKTTRHSRTLPIPSAQVIQVVIASATIGHCSSSKRDNIPHLVWPAKKKKNTQSLVFPAQALPPSPFHSNMAAKLATVTCVNLVVGPVLKCPQPLETQRYTLRQLRGSSFFFTFQCHHQTEDRDDLMRSSSQVGPHSILGPSRLTSFFFRREIFYSYHWAIVWSCCCKSFWGYFKLGAFVFRNNQCLIDFDNQCVSFRGLIDWPQISFIQTQ